MKLKRAFAAVFLMLSFAAPVVAGPFEDAAAAHLRGDYATSLPQFRSLAEQGNAKAQTMLGLVYYNGIKGVPRDFAEAAKWFRVAANQGDPDAQYNLGLIFSKGEGVPQNDTEAVKWFGKSADQGNANAQKYLRKYMDAALDSIADAFNKANAAAGLQPQAAPAAPVPQAAPAVDRCPTIPPPPPASAVYSPEKEQQAMQLADMIKDPMERMRVRALLKQEYANDRMMSEINAKAAVGYYLHAIRQIRDDRDDREASRQFKEQCVKKLIDTMWNDPRLKYGNTAGELEKSMQTLAGVDDTTHLGPGYRSPAKITPGSPSPTKPESEAISGTAFFVSKEGAAVTNAHVVESCQQIRVIINGQQAAARVVASDEKNDLALLATDLKPIQSANWRLSVRQGEDIVAYGFPLTGVLASGGNVVVGNVTALAGLDNDSRFLQISAPVQPGNSGGPLLDRAGNVVGIVVAKLNAIGIASVTGDIPQNVNFAIKASVAAAFLDAQRVVHPQGQDTASLSTPDLSERAKAFTAQVVCVR